MSLDVSPALLAQAETGPVEPDAFLEAVRTSLPYAYAMVERLATERLAAGARAPFSDNVAAPESEAERGQLLRALATEDYLRFTSERAQLLNQSPELRDC